MIKEIVKIFVLFVPYGVWKFFHPYRPRGVLRYFKHKRIFLRNLALKNYAAKNEARCFILCNGPSVKQQDITLLKDELVISVASGYLHKQFSVINPKFHCVPQITYENLTEADIVEWFIEMDSHLGQAKLILSDTEYDLVKRYRLFKSRDVYFLNMGRIFKDNENKMFDLTKMLPAPASVPIMCLIVAMYMGYRKIYLLGTEHDSFRTNEYQYAFETKSMKGKDSFVKENGKLKGFIYDALKSSTLLWEQYRTIKKLASDNGVCIYNATLGGALDEFERLNLEDIFPNKT